jgi:hypothetical protein
MMTLGMLFTTRPSIPKELPVTHWRDYPGLEVHLPSLDYFLSKSGVQNNDLAFAYYPCYIS